MYLETILILKKRNDVVRSVDIANELNFSKPSVSRAVGILKDDGYITVDGSGFIELTAEGAKVAKYIYEKHKTLTEFFTTIAKVSPEIAEEDACRIEHVISDETFQALKKILEEKKI
jgi:DtxR family Mn-dependent transcriptional regulator